MILELVLSWCEWPHQRQTDRQTDTFLIRLWALCGDQQPIWQTGERGSWGWRAACGRGSALWLDFFISRCQGPLTHGHTPPTCTHEWRVRMHGHTNTHKIPLNPIQVKVWDLMSLRHAETTHEPSIWPLGNTADLFSIFLPFIYIAIRHYPKWWWPFCMLIPCWLYVMGRDKNESCLCWTCALIIQYGKQFTHRDST